MTCIVALVSQMARPPSTNAEIIYRLANFPNLPKMVHFFPVCLWYTRWVMISRHHYNDSLTWIDVTSPTSEEVRTLMQEYHINPRVAEELLAPSTGARLESDPDHLFVALHFPALRHTHTISGEQEVDFILSKEHLITVRYDTIDALHKFEKVFEVTSILSKDGEEPHAGDIFFAILTKLYRSIGHELEFIHDRLEDAEEDIFDGQEKEMVVVLSNLSRDLLNIKQALTSHQDVLQHMQVDARMRFGETFDHELQSIKAEYDRIDALRRMNMDSLRELRETNNSLVSTKQNEIMKILTIVAFVITPLNFVASTFGMNAVNMPIVGTPGDFWVILGIMFSATLLIFAYFKHRKWL